MPLNIKFFNLLLKTDVFQPQGPREPEETGLPLNYDGQAQKRQQLQADRQREYNEMLAKVGWFSHMRSTQLVLLCKTQTKLFDDQV